MSGQVRKQRTQQHVMHAATTIETLEDDLNEYTGMMKAVCDGQLI